LVLGAFVALAAPPRWNGIAVTPYSEDPARGLSFMGMIDEIAEVGATHVSVVVQWSQNNVESHHIGPHPKETQDEGVVRAMIRRARARGLRVMLFPILWIENRGPGLWRGTLRPKNPPQWWGAYRAFILHFAELARVEGVETFSVGSELASMEADEARWRALIGDVRGRFPGLLTYSANWDHYESVPFWDALDIIGMTGYHRLVPQPTGEQPDESALRDAWRRVHGALVTWRDLRWPGRRLLFTELGYPSLDGAAYRPWEYTLGGTLDLEEQRRCYAAFVDVWRDEAALAGVFFWNWWGHGGVGDTNYTPRGKPALDVVRRFFGSRRSP
jgi:hypothetical protein